jgi:hypothetical protein
VTACGVCARRGARLERHRRMDGRTFPSSSALCLAPCKVMPCLASRGRPPRPRACTCVLPCLASRGRSPRPHACTCPWVRNPPPPCVALTICHQSWQLAWTSRLSGRSVHFTLRAGSRAMPCMLRGTHACMHACHPPPARALRRRRRRRPAEHARVKARMYAVEGTPSVAFRNNAPRTPLWLLDRPHSIATASFS